MSYFVFNGVSSSTLGIRIQSKNVYSAPKYDVSLTSIPGRNGDIVSANGRFSNVSLSYTCFVPAKSIAELSEKITAIKNWLYREPDRYHDLTDSYDASFKRMAIFNSKLDISDEASKIGTFTVTFSCKPQRYLISSLASESHTESFIIDNPYPLNAKPYIKITGTGDITLAIQSESQNKVWTMTAIGPYIECDSELMNFYRGTDLKNDKVTGDGFPELLPGSNAVSWTGNVTKVEIVRRLVTL